FGAAIPRRRSRRSWYGLHQHATPAGAPRRTVGAHAAHLRRCGLRSSLTHRRMRSLRCSPAPSIWATCAPNLSTRSPAVIAGGRSRVLLMHPILDPGPAILAEAAEVISYPPDRPLDEANIRQAAEGCIGIVSQLMDPIRETVLSSPGLRCVSNVAVGFDNIDLAAATAHKVMVTNTPGVLDDATADFAFTLLMATARRVV